MVEKKKPGSVPARVEDTQSAAALYEADAGTGFEGTTNEDYIVPFIKLLQKMSPEVDQDSGSYVDGAKAGMFIDTGTNELLETVDFIPCHYHRTIVEWRDRDSGGGFIAQHEVGYEQQFSRDDSGRYVTPNGTYLADTRYFFGLRLRADGDTSPVVVSFTSTQLKKSRTWLTRMQALKFTKSDGSRVTLPIFSHVWRISSVPEENERGSWRGYKIELVNLITDARIIKSAKKANEMFRSSAMKVKPHVDTGHTGNDVPF